MPDIGVFVEESLQRIRELNLHGIFSKPPRGFLRGVDVLGNDFERAMNRSVAIFYRNHRYLPNLLNPSTFTEKQLLFKFFGPIPIHSPSNKLAAIYYVPEHLRTATKQPKICWKSSSPKLPQNGDVKNGRYWLKSNHSSGRNRAIEFPICDQSRAELEKLMSRWMTTLHDKHRAVWWYEIFCRKVYLEEDLGMEGLSAHDWKFFVCNGKVILYQCDQDRFSGHDQTIYDRNGNHLSNELYYPGSKVVPPPAKLDEMVSLAEAIGEAFDFIRVDLFLEAGEIYLGEIGLVPNGCTIPIRSPIIDHTLGQSWNCPWLGQMSHLDFDQYANTMGRRLFDLYPVDLSSLGHVWRKHANHELPEIDRLVI